MDADGEVVRLRDGHVLRLRPIRPEDKEGLLAGLARLSFRSRYRRFLAEVQSLSRAQLVYLTEVDQRDHLAWCAVDPADLGEPLVGVARCIRDRERPDEAEAAVVVADAYQQRGLGTLLMERLAREAAAVGIRCFRASVMAENRPVLAMLEEAGARLHRVPGGVLEVEVPLRRRSGPAETFPESPVGAVFRGLAREEVDARDPAFVDRAGRHVDGKEGEGGSPRGEPEDPAS